MSKQISRKRHVGVVAVCTTVLLGLLFCAMPRALAQATTDYQEERKRAMELFDQNKFADAIPIMEKLVAANNSDVVLLERLGWATLVVSGSMKDPQERKKARDRARTLLMRAKDLGDNSELLQTGLENLSQPDPSEMPFSNNKEADAAMREGEEAHTRGDLDKAIAAYQRALKLDPTLYMAALFTGDMYFKKGVQAKDAGARKAEMDRAGEWFARAIAIDENIETAHRYWGDALKVLGLKDESRAKFVEAIIAEPYNRRSYVGLLQWAEQFRVPLGHPRIDQPKPSMSASTGKDNQTTITIDPKALDPKQGAAYYWSFYDLTRSTYPATFQKEFPNEKTYRHSLKEEATALRIVAEMVANDLKSGKLKSLDDPSLANLMRLHNAGLIEPYVLFARADEGIARDFDAYRKADREKLRRYWTEIVISAAK
ncbi:MAG TPA: tetratricopeptide repeat protein [Pyrinomonadaceae bacterium]